MVRHLPMFIIRGPMAGQIVPATIHMLETARAGGYGMQPGVDGVPPRADRGPHAAGERFAAAYADRQLRAALYAGGDPMAEIKTGLEPGTSGNEAGHVPEGVKRKRGRPPGVKGGIDG
jgi:hypothetical protein